MTYHRGMSEQLTDWTTCRVVRDGKGGLWTGDGLIRGLVGDGLVGAESAAYEHALGPLVPVLDADGVPVVRTVGDLTARHYNKRVRLGGETEGRISRLSLDEWGRLDLTLVSHHAGLRRTNEWVNIPLGTPCELLL